MHVNPYGRDPVRFLCDLANHPLTGPADLAARCQARNMPFDDPPAEHDVALVDGFVAAWTTVVDAPDLDTRAARLNLLLARWAAHPRLTNHASHPVDGWHIHYRADDLPPGAVIAAVGSVGTALHLTGRGMHRLARCAVDGCTAVFADVSRAGRQRYCGQPCANRDAVRRHRATRR